MSAPEHVLRSRQWLEEQLELLGNLRNANPRDPSFKLWRQNTLTVLQRIWHGEQARSTRFRHIPFSPNSPKADFATVREWYTRGCAEAADYLRALIVEVDSIGVPHPGEAPASEPTPIGDDVDFPVLELSGDGSSPASSFPGADEADIVLLDKTGTAAALAPDDPKPDAAEPGTPAPPKLHVDVTTPPRPTDAPGTVPVPPGASASPSGTHAIPALPRRSTGTGGRNVSPSTREDAPRKPAAPPPRPQPAAEAAPQRRNGRNGRGRKAPPRQRLKDMLGLQDIGRENARAAEAPPVRASEKPAPRASQPAPPATPPARVTPHAPAPPAARAPETPPAPVPAPPAAADAPAPPAAPVPAETHASGPPDAEGTQRPLDPEAFARATEDFLRSSPVLGLQGKPVQRASDTTQFQDPDAVALATLAADIARHVRDEDSRVALRAGLLELARQLEQQAPEWAALRDTVAAAMAHPELAKRLMPIVLPWLGRAA